MSRTKYIMSGGLAFSEDGDMKKLQSYSLKGWHVTDFKFMGYALEKGESKQYIYSIDYNSLEEGEEAEYFDLFSSSGWTHVASEDDIHLFRAAPGTKPIYSDRDTSFEKYGNLNRTVNKLAVPLFLFTALAWIGAIFGSGTLQTWLLGAAGILSILALPAAWTAIAAYSNKWKVNGKNGIAILIKIGSGCLLFSGLFGLFLIADPERAGQVGISSFIGPLLTGISAPIIIWAIMSLHQKLTS